MNSCFPRQRLTSLKTDLRHQRGLFLGNLGALSSGTILSQALLLCASPILTRLYSPSSLGAAAIFTAVLGILSPAVCGKYEIAVVNSRSLSDARRAFSVATRIGLLISLTLMPLIFAVAATLGNLSDLPAVETYLYALPFATAFLGIYTAAFQYTVRSGGLLTASLSRITHALAFILTAIAINLAWDLNGLIIGIPVAWLAALLVLLTPSSRLHLGLLRWFSARDLEVLRRHSRLPQYNAPTAILDGITCALPAIAIGFYTDFLTVGYYSLIVRVTLGPLTAVGSAVSTLNQHTIATQIRCNQSPAPHFRKLLAFLLIAAFAIVFLTAGAGPMVFGLLFGANWEAAGPFLRVLAPSIAIRFVASTLSSTFGATGNDRLAAGWRTMAFLATTVTLFALPPPNTPLALFTRIALLDAILYTAYLVLAWLCVLPTNFALPMQNKNAQTKPISTSPNPQF